MQIADVSSPYTPCNQLYNNFNDMFIILNEIESVRYDLSKLLLTETTHEETSTQQHFTVGKLQYLFKYQEGVCVTNVKF